ncbi:hypothetical protein PMAYCL1PPCAC_06574, partial [Pristionchus mayeri]
HSFIPMASTLQMALLLSLLLFSLSVHAFDDYHPILMDRRDAPFNGLLNDLKTQTLGGRMRFGKRSGGGSTLPLNQWPSPLFDRPL